MTNKILLKIMKNNIIIMNKGTYLSIKIKYPVIINSTLKSRTKDTTYIPVGIKENKIEKKITIYL